MTEATTYHAIRQHAGTACVLRFGDMAMTFRDISALDRLKFHARLGQIRQPVRSEMGWWKAAELIENLAREWDKMPRKAWPRI